MRPIRIAGGLALSALLIACGDEGPVALDELVSEDLIETFELVLDASDFLVADTSISGFVLPNRSRYLVVAAEDGEDGSLDVHGLLRFERPPTKITYVDSTGTTRTDSSVTPFGGELKLSLDTIHTRADGPFDIALNRVREAWDPATATWELRIDSAGVREAWAEPGAMGGELIGLGKASAKADTVRIPIDSVTAAQMVTSGAGRSVVLSIPTRGASVLINGAWLSLDYRPAARPDTVVTLSVRDTLATFIATPPPSTENRLLVGGAPAWRAFINLRERLDTLSVPCPGGEDGCGLRLDDVEISYAALLLQPVAASTGYAPADTVRFNVRPVFGLDQLPLNRAPLGDSIGAQIRVAPSAFGPDGRAVEIPVTFLISALATSPDSRPANMPEPPTTLAVLGSPEAAQFGLAAFGDRTAGPAAPRLRIIFSVIREAVFP